MLDEITAVKNEIMGSISQHSTYCNPKSWMRQVQFVNELVFKTNVIVSIIAEQGCGKTTFAHLLKAEVTADIKTYYLKVSPGQNSEVFLMLMARQVAGKTFLSMKDFVEDIQQAQKHVLILIDDAQFISQDILKAFLQALPLPNEQSFFHLCLLNNASLLPTLKKLAKNFPDVLHTIYLPQLSELETHNYVKSHLKSNANITEAELKHFYQLTAGNIAAMNRHIKEIVKHKNRHWFKWALNEKGLNRLTFIAVPICAMIGLMLIINKYDGYHSVENLHFASKLFEENVEELPSIIPPYEVAAVRQYLEPVSLRRAEILINYEPDDSPIDESMVVLDKVVVIPKIIMPKLIEKEQKPVQTASHQKIKTHQKVVKNNSKQPKLVKNNSFTIQLLASSSLSELQSFVRQHHLEAQTHIMRTNRNQGPWYILTYGSYDKRQKAKDELKKLPQQLANNKPWIRTTTDLKSI